jgi:WD40 repeat protein
MRLGLLLGAAACLAGPVGIEIWTQPEQRAAYAVVFAPQGDRVAAVMETKAEGTGRLWIWDVATGRRISSANIPDRPLSLAYSPDGTAVATGGWNGTVKMWDPASGRVLRSFSGHSYPVRGLAFTPDGRMLAAGASDGRVIFWDLKSGRERMRLDRGSRFPVNGMAISHDGRFLAAAGGRGAGAVSVWDLKTAQPGTPVALAAASEPIAFAPHQAVLAAVTAGSISLVDLDRDRAISTIPLGGVRSLALSPDSRLVAVGRDNETIIVRDVRTGRSVANYAGHRRQPDALGGNYHNLMADVGLAERRIQHTVWSVAFSPDGTRLASAGQDGAVWLWGLPGRDAKAPPDRVLLARPSRPEWLPIIQVTLGLSAVALLASALLAKGK